MTFACNNIDVQAVVDPGRYLLALPASLAQIQLGRVPAFIHLGYLEIKVHLTVLC